MSLDQSVIHAIVEDSLTSKLESIGVSTDADLNFDIAELEREELLTEMLAEIEGNKSRLDLWR